MRVALFQLDGRLPNLALMPLAAHHRARGDAVELVQLRSDRRPPRELFRARGLFDDWDRVYASLIFEKTRPLARRLLAAFPGAVLGGTGWNETLTLEGIGVTTLAQDYTDWPAFRSSLGYSQRGCRFDCWFCKVPRAEPGPVRSVSSIAGLWRGEPWPREILLLDNDFFGQKAWPQLIDELRAGAFRVSFNQGVNVRVLTDEHAAALASVDYRDDGMTRKRLYLAWDDTADERRVFRGMEALARHGIRPDHLVVYMLIGAGESEADRLHRARRLREFGAHPYPMPYVRNDETRGFQRWCVRNVDTQCTWEEFKRAGYRAERIGVAEGAA